jgi:hypothetical protein
MGLGDIAILMMDRVLAPELLLNEFRNHFKPYLERHHLCCNEILRDYCMSTMNTTHAEASEYSWILRFLVLYECMDTNEMKLEIALEFMRRLPIPWSRECDELIQKVRKENKTCRHRRIIPTDETKIDVVRIWNFLIQQI